MHMAGTSSSLPLVWDSALGSRETNNPPSNSLKKQRKRTVQASVSSCKVCSLSTSSESCLPSLLVRRSSDDHSHGENNHRLIEWRKCPRKKNMNMYVLLTPHVGPSHPSAHKHVSGAEQVAPFSHTSVHTAKYKNRKLVDPGSTHGTEGDLRVVQPEPVQLAEHEH